MAVNCVPLPVVVAVALIACSETVEGFVTAPCVDCKKGPDTERRRRREQFAGSFCDEETDMCNSCGGMRPEPKKPDGSYDAAGAVAHVASGGFTFLKSEILDGALSGIEKLSFWGYVGAGLLDGISGAVDAGKQKAAWNTYKLESFISNSTDYVVCEVKAIVGDYFQKYMDIQDLCHYNIGVDGMAGSWLDSCGSRQCLNLTDLPADRRGDCCSPSATAGDSMDCQSWSAEQIATGQGSCRLQDENFQPGSGVCSRQRVCYHCMDFQKAIEMTQAQIASYETSPTNWGAALEGYANIDAVIAQARGTMMMIAFYQELILLGSPASLRNFQLFSKTAYEEMQSKVDGLMSSAPSVVTESSCTYSTPPATHWQEASNCCTSTPTELRVGDFCLYTRMGCRGAYSMVGMDGCADLGTRFCGDDQSCSVCTSLRGCGKLSCYDKMNGDDEEHQCDGAQNWDQVRQEEERKATAVLKAHYVATLQDVSRFLDILRNYSQEPLNMSIFGAYLRLGYRMPSCDASTGSHTSIAKCQHVTPLTSSPGLPHWHFHP